MKMVRAGPAHGEHAAHVPHPHLHHMGGVTRGARAPVGTKADLNTGSATTLRARLGARILAGQGGGAQAEAAYAAGSDLMVLVDGIRE
jgi:hypothetical protein